MQQQHRLANHTRTWHRCGASGRRLWHGPHACAAAQPLHQQQQQHPPQQPPPSVLGDVRVVLVAPKTPANVGAAARCCANFEVCQLWVVAPRCDPRSPDAYTVACGPTVLDSMVVVDDLPAALADTTGSIGFTRRAGATRLTYASISHMLSLYPDTVPNTTLTPTLLTTLLQPPTTLTTNITLPPPDEPPKPQPHPPNTSHPTQGGGHTFAPGVQGVTAVVFGREESGLTESELRCVSHACGILTGRVQGSMNLSHAVAVVLGEFYQRRLAFQEVMSLDPESKVLALTGQLPDAHPAAPTLANLSWITPLTLLNTQRSTHSIHTSDTPGVVAGGGGGGGGGGTQLSDARLKSPSSEVQEQGDESLRPATAAETESLMNKLTTVAEAVGISGAESRGGGNAGSHGRRRLPLGHLRAVLYRARPMQGEVRSLHGFVSKVMAALGVLQGTGGSTAKQEKHQTPPDV